MAGLSTPFETYGPDPFGPDGHVDPAFKKDDSPYKYAPQHPRTTASLLSIYRKTLKELDDREALYTPHRRPTNTASALLIYRDIEDTDQLERARKSARDREKAELRDKLLKQRKHPLFHTHHRPHLIKIWDTTGEPTTPEKALINFPRWLQQHASATEEDIREQAIQLEKAHTLTIKDRLGIYANRFFREKDPTELTEKNLKRALRTAFRQYNEQAASILGIVGKYGQQYVSDHTRGTRRHQLSKQQKWIEATTLTAPDGHKVPLADVIRTPEHRFSELYTLVKGQEQYFTNQGFIPVFITLTSPPAFHPNPSHGKKSWNGASPRESHEWFNANWQNTRAALAKEGIRLDGFRVTEPHKDGAEHWHILAYIKTENISTVIETLKTYFSHSKSAVKYITDFTDADAGTKGKATPASYMLKYLIKTISSEASTGTTAANDQTFKNDAAAVDAWRSTWGIRGFQFFGQLFGKQTLWRELRRLETQPEEDTARKLWRAARGGRGAVFISLLITEQPELSAIYEQKEVWLTPDPATGETEKTTKKGRLVGVEINQVPYITHKTKYELSTDNSIFNEGFPSVTVIPKDPRGLDTPAETTASPPNSDPPDHRSAKEKAEWAEFLKYHEAQKLAKTA